MVPYHGHEYNEYNVYKCNQMHTLLTMMSHNVSMSYASFHPVCVSFISRQVLCRIGLHEVHSTIDQADLTAPLDAVNAVMITPKCLIDLIASCCNYMFFKSSSSYKFLQVLVGPKTLWLHFLDPFW